MSWCAIDCKTGSKTCCLHACRRRSRCRKRQQRRLLLRGTSCSACLYVRIFSEGSDISCVLSLYDTLSPEGSVQKTRLSVRTPPELQQATLPSPLLSWLGFTRARRAEDTWENAGRVLMRRESIASTPMLNTLPEESSHASEGTDHSGLASRPKV